MRNLASIACTSGSVTVVAPVITVGGMEPDEVRQRFIHQRHLFSNTRGHVAWNGRNLPITMRT